MTELCYLCKNCQLESALKAGVRPKTGDDKHQEPDLISEQMIQSNPGFRDCPNYSNLMAKYFPRTIPQNQIK